MRKKNKDLLRVRKCHCGNIFIDWFLSGICREHKKGEEGMTKENPYKIPSKPTRFHDQWHGSVLYCSLMEARCARVLDRAGIEFTPQVEYTCFDRQGKKFSYTVDFVMKSAQDLLGISKWITFIEIKGVLTTHDILRLEALQYCHQIKGYIVTESLLDLWEREGVKK